MPCVMVQGADRADRAHRPSTGYELLDLPLLGMTPFSLQSPLLLPWSFFFCPQALWNLRGPPVPNFLALGLKVGATLPDF